MWTCVSTPPGVGSVLLTSESPKRTAMQLVKEHGLELLGDYLRRSTAKALAVRPAGRPSASFQRRVGAPTSCACAAKLVRQTAQARSSAPANRNIRVLMEVGVCERPERARCH